MNKKFFVYVVKTRRGYLYTGISTDPVRRVREHNEGRKGAKCLLGQRPVKLIWWTVSPMSRSRALKLESKIKKLTRKQKILFLSMPNTLFWKSQEEDPSLMSTFARRGRKLKMKKFADIRTGAARGLQIWQILIGKAHNRQTITYEKLAVLMGFKKKAAICLPQMLGKIYHYCNNSDLPPLTILVVGKKSGMPGDGMPEGNRDDLREEVYNYKWYRIVPPSLKELDKI